MSFQEKLKQARFDAHMTQEQAADSADISRYSIQRYELGQTEPSASTLKSLADVYGKNLDWFWSGQEQETSPNAVQIALQEAQSDLSDEEIKK